METESDNDGFRIIEPDDFESIEDMEYRLGNLDSMSRSKESWALAVVAIAVILLTIALA